MSEKSRGRPHIKRNPRGHEAVKLPKSTAPLLKSPVSPPPEPDASLLLPELPSGICALTAEETQYVALASLTFGCPLSTFAGPTTEAPLFLDTIKWLKAGGKFLGRISTVDLPHWFDAQKNDLNCYNAHTRNEAVSSRFLAILGSSPIDIRARPFVVQWKESSLLSSRGKLEAIQKQRVVMRWEYKCRGICSVELENDGETSMLRKDNAESKSRRGRWWDLCNGNVKLVIELTADDLTHANIWQLGEHPNAAQGLNWSRRLRNLVSERLRLGGARCRQSRKNLSPSIGSQRIRAPVGHDQLQPRRSLKYRNFVDPLPHN